MPRYAMPSLVVLLCLMLLPGCNWSPAARFNNAIVRGTEKLHKAGEDFGRAVSTAINTGKDNDISKVEAAYGDAEKVLKAVREDMKGLTVPPGQAAKELHQAALEFLDQEERRLDQDFRAVMRVARDKQLTIALKQKEIGEILTRAL